MPDPILTTLNPDEQCKCGTRKHDGHQCRLPGGEVHVEVPKDKGYNSISGKDVSDHSICPVCKQLEVIRVIRYPMSDNQSLQVFVHRMKFNALPKICKLEGVIDNHGIEHARGNDSDNDREKSANGE